MKIWFNIVAITLGFLAPASITAQNLEGKWEGQVVQDGKRFKFYCVINLKDGTQRPYEIYGHTYQYARRHYGEYNEIHSTMFFEGVFEGNKVKYKELRFDKEHTTPGFNFCIKNSTLAFTEEEGEYRLEGTFLGQTKYGNPCAEGTIVLSKEAPLVNEHPQEKLNSCDLSWMIGQWPGWCSQYSASNYKESPASFEVVKVDSCTFSGKMYWPDGMAQTTDMIGFVEEGQIHFNELETLGKTSYVAELTDNYTIKGFWKDEMGYLGAHYEFSKIGIPYTAPETTKKPDKETENPLTTDRIIPEKVRNREVEIVETFKLSKMNQGASLKVLFWDSGVMDGDSVSFNFNGEWIVKGYPLGKEKAELTLPLTAGSLDNYLVLYADNLGKRPPNTATFLLRYGKEEHKITLRSDTKTCEAIKIKLVGDEE